MVRLLPLVLAECALFLIMLPYLVRWVGIQSFTWGFWYEGHPKIDFPAQNIKGGRVHPMMDHSGQKQNLH